MEQVASMTWEETRFWLNTLPGTKTAEQIQIIRAICKKNVSYWPKPERPYIPADPAPPKPTPQPEQPAKPKPKRKSCPPKKDPGADLAHFRNLFSR